ncbi:hypothetical protein FMUND_15576, partial [Fusarium mundagurra]
MSLSSSASTGKRRTSLARAGSILFKLNFRRNDPGERRRLLPLVCKIAHRVVQCQDSLVEELLQCILRDTDLIVAGIGFGEFAAMVDTNGLT